MTRIIFCVALTLCAIQSSAFAASGSSKSEVSSQKLCCQREVGWKHTEGSRCTSCHTRYFDEVYGEYSGELPRYLQPCYIKDYISVVIKTLNFKNDRRTCVLLKRMLNKIPSKYSLETARFFLDAAENMNMSVECLRLLQAYGAQRHAQDDEGNTAETIAAARNNLVVRNYFLPRSSEASEEQPQQTLVTWPDESHSAMIFIDENETQTIQFFGKDDSIIFEQQTQDGAKILIPACKHFFLQRLDLSDSDEAESESETEEYEVDNVDIIEQTSASQEDEWTLEKIGGAGGVPGLWPEPGSDVEVFFGSYQPPQKTSAKRATHPKKEKQFRHSKRSRQQHKVLLQAQNKVSDDSREHHETLSPAASSELEDLLQQLRDFDPHFDITEEEIGILSGRRAYS